MSKTTLTVLLCAFLLICNHRISGQALSNGHVKIIEKQVDSVFQEMLGLAEEVNYDGLSIGVDDKYNAGFITNGIYYSKYTDLIKALKPSAQGVSRQEITIKDKKITVLADNLVLMTTAGKSFVILDNGSSFDVKIQWSFVYKKIDGAWKVIHSHQSSKR